MKVIASGLIQMPTPGDGAGEQRRPAITGGRGEARGQTDQDHRQQQEQAVMVGPADAGVGEHGRLGQQDQAGEQPGVAIERGRCGPGDRREGEPEQDRADQHAPEMQRAGEAQQRLEQPGAGEQQRVQRPGPVLDVAHGRIDARLARIEPGAAVVQVQHPGQAHVGVGIGERSVEHRHDPGQREQHLDQREAAERDRDQPAERRLVRRGASGNGRLRRHRSSQQCDGAGAAWPGRGKLCPKPSTARVGRRALCCNAK